MRAEMIAFLIWPQGLNTHRASTAEAIALCECCLPLWSAGDGASWRSVHVCLCTTGIEWGSAARDSSRDLNLNLNLSVAHGQSSVIAELALLQPAPRSALEERMEPERAGGVDKSDFEKWSEMASLIRQRSNKTWEEKEERRTRGDNATGWIERVGLETRQESGNDPWRRERRGASA